MWLCTSLCCEDGYNQATHSVTLQGTIRHQINCYISTTRVHAALESATKWREVDSRVDLLLVTTGTRGGAYKIGVGEQDIDMNKPSLVATSSKLATAIGPHARVLTGEHQHVYNTIREIKTAWELQTFYAG